MHVANTTRRPGRLRLIHMQMQGGAGAKKREEMSPSESSTGERSERGKETACSEECRGEDRLLFFTARGAALLREAAEMSEQPWRQMTDARGGEMDGGTIANSQDIR